VDQFFDAFRQALHGIGGSSRVGGIFGTDQQCDFAFRGPLFERGEKLGEFAAAKFLVELGDFAGDAGAAIAQHFAGVGNAFRDAMRGLVENDGAIFDAQSFEGAAPFAATRGQKANKQKFFIGQAAGGKGGEKGRWSGHGHNGNVVPQAKRDEAMARVGNERHAGVTHEGDFRALFERDEQLRRTCEFIVLVVADKGLANFVVVEKLLRVARVFAGDLVDFLQDAQSPQRYVFQVADGSADQIQATSGLVSIVCSHSHPQSLARAGETVWSACYTFLFGAIAEGVAVPLYEYRCLKCNRHTEKIEPVAGPHLKKCPHCGGKVESVITAPAIKFKGSGWYVTDYAGKSTEGGSKETKPAADSKDSGGKDAAAKDAKDGSSKEAPGKDSAAKETASKESSSKEKKLAKKK
jgi:putative FmdB family regulatory protein